MSGEITLYWGTMYSGKTSALINELIKACEGAICFKPVIDNRYSDDCVVSHDGIQFPATPIQKASEIFLLLDNKITTIGIDEASLFEDDPSFIPTVLKLRDMGYHVILAGLDRTSEDTVFSSMAYLAAVADNCIKLRTKCNDCKTNLATISFYIGKEPKTSAIKVGGVKDYIPLCRNCANKRWGR